MEFLRKSLRLRDWNHVQQTEHSPPQTLNPIQLLGPRHIQSEDYSSKVQSYLILWEWDGYDRSDLLKIKLFTLDVKRQFTVSVMMDSLPAEDHHKIISIHAKWDQRDVLRGDFHLCNINIQFLFDRGDGGFDFGVEIKSVQIILGWLLAPVACWVEMKHKDVVRLRGSEMWCYSALCCMELTIQLQPGHISV